jgi:hypothetical protein
VLLLATGAARADPPGVIERIEKGGGRVRRAGNDPTGRADAVVLPFGATDADLAGLCELRGMERLALWETHLTDDGWRTVAGLPQVAACN